jgi:FAD/FMN-containing dehydrogenase
VLRFFREFASTAPDALGIVSALTHAPDGSGLPLSVIAVCHAGPPEQAEADIAALRGFGSPVLSEIGPVPYSVLNQALDAAFPRGALNYWKANFLRELSDEAIDVMVEQFAECPSPMSALLLEHFHGAVTRIPVDATAYAQRAVADNFLVASQWLDPAESERQIKWARATFRRMEPFMAEGRYVNYLGADEDGDQVARAYGPNFERLSKVKADYDPDNLFHHNQNVAPARAAGV